MPAQFLPVHYMSLVPPLQFRTDAVNMTLPMVGAMLLFSGRQANDSDIGIIIIVISCILRRDGSFDEAAVIPDDRHANISRVEAGAIRALRTVREKEAGSLVSGAGVEREHCPVVRELHGNTLAGAGEVVRKSTDSHCQELCIGGVGIAANTAFVASGNEKVHGVGGHC